MNQIKPNKVIQSTLYHLHKKTPYIIQQGGTYSGKTYGIMVALLQFALQATQRLTITVVGQTVPHLNTGVKKDFEAILETHNLQLPHNKVEKLYTLPNGTTIRFLAVDKLGKAKGGKRDILFINECNEIPYTIAEQLMLRTNDTVIMDYNPTGEFWWQRKKLPTLEKNQYFFLRTTYKDNPAISEKKIKDIESLKLTDEQLYKVYALGLTGKVQGLVFPAYNLVDAMPNIIGNGLDFGFTNDPTALIEVGYQNGELYLNEQVYETNLTNADIALRINNNKIIIADCAEPKSIAEIKSKGINIEPAKKGKDSINFGIQIMKRFKINITKTSLNLIKEFNNYKWAVNADGEKTNKPIDRFNHAIDAVRYYVMYRFELKNVITFEIENNPNYWIR